MKVKEIFSGKSLEIFLQWDETAERECFSVLRCRETGETFGVSGELPTPEALGEWELVKGGDGRLYANRPLKFFARY